MYNLLMFGHDGYWDERKGATLEYDRFLSYTHEAIKARLLKLSDKAIAELIGMPTLFAYEFTRDLPKDPNEDLPRRLHTVLVQLDDKPNARLVSDDFVMR